MSNKLIIRIDNQQVEPEEVIFHFQTDPFPGGHFFEMVIPRNAISSELWKYAKFQDTENPQEDKARDWFYWLPSIVHGFRLNENIRAKFVLNSIKKIIVNFDNVLIHGVCSLYIRNG
jgi:hypothetical protein